jgi:hypothetical protein
VSITIKQKLLNAITAHPKLVTLGIGLALTLAIGTSMAVMFSGPIVVGQCCA